MAAKLSQRAQSGTGMIRYRTEIPDAGKRMPAASALMQCPSYAIVLVSMSWLIYASIL